MYNKIESLTRTANKVEHNPIDLNAVEFTIFMLSCPSQLFNKLNIDVREKLTDLRNVDILSIELRQQVNQIREQMLTMMQRSREKYISITNKTN